MTEKEREENKKINECHSRNRRVQAGYDPYDDSPTGVYDAGTSCPMKAVDAKHDKCSECGLVFTYS